ncbi:MAG TPA: hypothetical protein VF774_14085 [Pseudoduganella sp.]
MIPMTLSMAQALRDMGIDAMSALDNGLPAALAGLPDDEARELKRLVGSIMGEVCDQLINPAVRAFPELEADPATWMAVAKERARTRSA